jgi:hypothetical protein
MQLGLGLSLTNLRGGGFSPAVLFAAGEQGAWYDPSDITTLFQDNAGTTPVTAAGQSVAIMLDKSQGLVLGPEEAVSVGSSTWTNNGDGSFSITNANAGSGLNQSSLPLLNTRHIRISFTATGVSGVIALRTLGGGGGNTNLIISISNGDTVIIARSPNPDTIISFVATAGSSGTVSNISIRELPGNHATQANFAQRPIYAREPLTGRRNLLTFTEQFDNAVWVKSSTNITSNSIAAPDGTITADTASQTGSGSVQLASFVNATVASPHTLSWFCKRLNSDWIFIQILTGGTERARAWFNLATGTVGTVAAISPATNVTASIQALADGWYRCSVTGTLNGTGSTLDVFNRVVASDNSIVGVTGERYIWGAQLEESSTATAYQRVGNNFDVTEAGVPELQYLAFDGSDDGMATGNIVPGTDKAQVFAGVRKLSDAATGIVAEISANSTTNNGTFGVSAPNSAAANYGFISRGTAFVVTVPTGFTSPITNVLTGIGDIAAPNAILRIDGTQAASSTTSQGTGNYLTHPLFIGRRGGASLPLNGRIYGLLVRFGANLSAAQIDQTEAFMAAKTGVTL